MTKRTARDGSAPNGAGSVYYLQSKQRWMVSYHDAAGKRRIVTADRQTRPGAEAHLRRLLIERDSSVTAASLSSSNPTLSEWCAEWLAIKADAGCRPRTVEAYSERMRAHILPRLGSKRLQAITPDDIQATYRHLLRHRSPRLSASSVAAVHATLRAALITARRRRLISVAVTDLVEPPRPARYTARTLTVDECRRFLDGCAAHPHPTYGALWTFMLGTGARFGEAAGLVWSNVDLANGIARIRQQVTRERVRHHGNTRATISYVVAPVKTDAGRRTVALPPFVVDTLTRLRAARQQAPLPTDFVFPAPSSCDGLLRENVVLVAWHKFLHDIGLEGQPDQPRLRMHDLRHTKGTLMANGGEDTTTIQRTLGHARQSITADIYIGDTQAELSRAAQRFNDMLTIQGEGK